MNKKLYMAPVAQKITVQPTAILAGSGDINNDGTSGDTSNPGTGGDQGGAHAPLYNLWSEE